MPEPARAGGGREKIHPSRRNFNPVGWGQVSRLKKKDPKLKKCSVLGVCPGPLLGLKKCMLGRTINRPRVIAALEVLVDGSLNRVTLSELGSSELLLQLCRNLGIPLFGQYALFFRAYSPSRGAFHSCATCSYVVRLSVWAWAMWLDTWSMGSSRTDSGYTSKKILLKCCLVVLNAHTFRECDRAMWSHTWPVGAPGQCKHCC